MAMTLQRFANGDTNYIAKHNANADGLEAAVNGLQTQLATSFGASISIGDALLSLFGGSLALIGSVSYSATTSGSTLNVGPGYLWRPDTGMVQNGAGGALNFAGVVAGTYYVVPDASGAATRGTAATGATHTVVWSGSSFTSVTRTAAVLLNASDDSAALTSTVLGTTYVNLDARLEAGETLGTATQSEVTAARTSTTGGVYASLEARLEALEGEVGGAGTMTSVALAAPADFTVSGSPVTSSGTLTLTRKDQSAHVVLAGPASGSAAAPAYRALEAADLPAQPFDVHAFYPGTPPADAKIYRGKLARAVAFPANFSGAQFSASAAAAANTVFDIQKNGASIGTCTIAAGGTTPTFATTGGAAPTFAAGDLLTILAPTAQDATLADPAITLAGTR